MSDASATTAREYLRVSYVRGHDRSPEEQHADNDRAADRLGWTLGAPYRDKVSASRYARKVREDYARLVADLESGRFAANVLILWEPSRGSRKVSEWARLLELCEERAVKIFVTSDHKLYDPRDARDRRSLLEDAVDAEYESAKTSKRVTRSSASNAAAGRPSGPPPFGYRRTFDAATGRMTGQELDPVEAAIVREIFDRFNSGHSLRAIAADFAARGIRTRGRRPRGGRDRGEMPTPAPWTGQNLRSTLLNRAYVGERMHDPNGTVSKPSPGAAYYPATWKPIVSRAVWQKAYTRLTAPERKTTRPARAAHWLSFIARCDECGGPLTARRYPGNTVAERWYVCHSKTCVRHPYDDLTTYAEAVLLAYLGRDDVAEKLTAEPVDPGAVAAAEAEIAQIEQERDDLADQLGAGSSTARAMLARALPAIEARLTAARARRDELTAPSLLRGLIKPGKDVRRRWKATPPAARREIARLVFVPELVGELRVTRPDRPWTQPGPVRERVVWKRS